MLGGSFVKVGKLIDTCIDNVILTAASLYGNRWNFNQTLFATVLFRADQICNIFASVYWKLLPWEKKQKTNKQTKKQGRLSCPARV